MPGDSTEINLTNAGPADPAAKLDEAYIRQAFGGDLDFLSEVLQIYIQSSEGYIAQMNEALAHADFDAVRMIAHTMKGSSRSVGANVFAELCYAAEKGKTEEEIRKSAARLLQSAARLLDTCRARLAATATDLA